MHAGGARAGGDMHLLAFCCATAAELPYKKADEPLTLMNTINSIVVCMFELNVCVCVCVCVNTLILVYLHMQPHTPTHSIRVRMRVSVFECLLKY